MTPLSENGLTVRRYDRDRFVTALLAPPHLREDLFTLYAFNLEIARIRETVNEPMLGSIRLQWWRDSLDMLWQGGTVRHPAAAGLSELLIRHALPRPLFERMLEMRELDMRPDPPVDESELQLYADASAGGVNVLAAQILGGDEPTREAARLIGQAWGLVGLMRAYPYHLKSRRLYLPATWLAAESIDPEVLMAGESPPGLARLAEQCAGLAATHLRHAHALRRQVLRSVLPALLLAGQAEFHLRALRRTGYDLLDRRWSAQRSRPLALLGAMILRRF